MSAQKMLGQFIGLSLALFFAASPVQALDFVNPDLGGTGMRSRPAIAGNASAPFESYVMVFERKEGVPPTEVHARLLDSLGAPLPPASFSVSGLPAIGFTASRPSIAFKEVPGNYLVVWEERPMPTSPPGPGTIQGRVIRIDSFGSAVFESAVFLISVGCTADAKRPNAAAGPLNRYVVAYNCVSQGFSTVRVSTVHAFFFEPPIVLDSGFAASQGFEDSDAQAPHITFGDVSLAETNHFLLVYRTIFFSPSEYRGHKVASDGSVDLIPAIAQPLAEGSPVVGFSREGALLDQAAWTVVRRVVDGGATELRGQHFSRDLTVGPTYTVETTLDGAEALASYAVAGSPSTSDFMVAYALRSMDFDVIGAQVDAFMLSPLFPIPIFSSAKLLDVPLDPPISDDLSPDVSDDSSPNVVFQPDPPPLSEGAFISVWERVERTAPKSLLISLPRGYSGIL